MNAQTASNRTRDLRVAVSRLSASKSALQSGQSLGQIPDGDKDHKRGRTAVVNRVDRLRYRLQRCGVS